MDANKSGVASSRAAKDDSAHDSTTRHNSGKSDKWWTTPRTQAFIEAREELEAAYDVLMAIEADLRLRIEQRVLARQHNHKSNTLLQSLTHECIQFLVRQEMAHSLVWQEAWEHFSAAVLAAEQATQEFREEIEHATGRKQITPSTRAAALEIAAAQAAAGPCRKSHPRARHSA